MRGDPGGGRQTTEAKNEEHLLTMRLPDAQSIPTVLTNPEVQAQLDVISQLFYRTADGKTTIAEIGDVCGLEPLLAQRIAGTLASQGLLDIPGFFPLEKGGPTPSIPPRKSVEPVDPVLFELVTRYNALLASANHYELLGVTPDATRMDIRARYFELSKQLHPDRTFGRDIGDLRRQLEQIFQRVTMAYEILSHPARRGEYDATQGIVPKPSRTAPSPTSDMPPSAQRRSSVLPKAPSGFPTSISRSGLSSAPPRVSSIPPRPSEEPRPSGAPRPSLTETDDLHRRWQRERAGRALAVALGRSSLPPRSSKVPSTNLEEAKLAIDRERFEDAIRFLMPLLAATPEDTECLRLMETAKAGLARLRAKTLISRGLVERRRGNFDTAEELFSRAISVDASNLDAKHLIAEMLVERQINLGRAMGLVKEVISAGGQKARYYATLGDILFLNHDISRAGDAFRRALAIDPENNELRKKLEQCES
ncbi:MAG: DnaJ domain-containing protein [Myxococcota bacterium]|jgi:curved DNA-binding protein CbpA|nr:DnaJ domain-containing protein [Myxococcota bacterium]